jgi:outer membrane protein insertion porin family
MVQLRHLGSLLALLLLLPPGVEAQEEERGPEVLIREETPFTARRLRRVAAEELEAVESGDGGAADAADAAYEIESWIRERGYPEAVVRLRLIDETPAGDLRVNSSAAWETVDRLEVLVEPGEQVFLGEVTFPGAAAFDEERLRSFFPQGVEVPYRRQAIEEAVGQVRRLYTVSGYAERRLGPPEIETRQVRGVSYYDVTVPIEEGPRYLIEEITLESDELTEREKEELIEGLAILGEPYFPRQLAEGALSIREELGTRGYRATVERRGELESDGRARVVYRVDRGPLLLLEEVTVRNRGEDPLRTKERFIASFLPLEPGEPIDFSLLEETENRLYGLGIFALVDVGAVEGGGEMEPRPTTVEIAVRELRSQFLEVEAGWGSYEQLRGSLTFTDRNLFGLGRYWSTTVEGSFKSYGAGTTISDSMLLGPAGTIALSGSYRFRDGVSFDRESGEAELSLSYRLSRSWTLRGAYSFSRDLVTDVEGEIAGVEESDLATGRLQLSAERDTRDSVVTPRRGNYLLLSPLFSASLLGSEIDFTGGTAQFVQHLSFLERFTLSLSGEYRFRYRVGSDDPLPIQERLFLGGADSVRSFTLDTLGLVNDSGAPQGGMSSVEATAELRVRLVAQLHGALFYDYGFLSPYASSLSGDSGHAVGVGLRYYLPVGPVRLDFAYNPGERYAAERRWALHFAIGFSY